MAKHYEIKIVQRLTFGGTLGIWLFLGGPIVSAIGYAWLLAEIAKRYGGQSGFASLLTALGGFAFLGGCVMLLLGRYQLATIRTVEETESPTGYHDSVSDKPYDGPEPW